MLLDRAGNPNEDLRARSGDTGILGPIDVDGSDSGGIAQVMQAHVMALIFFIPEYFM